MKGMKFFFIYYHFFKEVCLTEEVQKHLRESEDKKKVPLCSADNEDPGSLEISILALRSFVRIALIILH